jgi:hypothetical protein
VLILPLSYEMGEVPLFFTHRETGFWALYGQVSVWW